MVFGLAAAVLAVACPPFAEADELADVDVPAMALDAALLKLAEQTDISVAFEADAIESAISSPVHGRLEPGDALDRALASTGFIAERVGDNAWKIIVATPADKTIPDWHPPHSIRLVAKPDTAGKQLADELESIIIISKRAEPLAQIARSVSVVGSDRLAEFGIESLPDLSGEVGAIQFSNVGSGRNKAYIRGISDGALAGRTQSTTGLYLGDVRLTYAAPDPNLRLIDIDSINILSGPQGALYGAGSIGGIVRIQPNPVDFRQSSLKAGASVELTGDRSIGSTADLIANLPAIKDKLGFRLVAYDQTTGGWIDHHNLDIDDANVSHRFGGRLSASWKANPGTEITLQAVSQDIDVDDSQYLIRDSGDAYRPSILEPHDNDFKLLSGGFETATPLGSLKSTASLLSHRTYSRYDATGLFADLLPDTSSPRPIDEDDKLFFVTNETRLSSSASARVPWFAGLFFSQGHTDRDIYLRDGQFGEWRDVAYEEDRRDRITEYALFGEAIWNLGEKLTLTTGARTFAYDIAVEANANSATSDIQQSYTGSLTKTGFAPDIRLKWQPTPQIMTYLSAAEGYRSPGFNTGGFADLSGPGGIQPNRVFRGDELWTYELGVRYVTRDSRAMMSATIFENEWNDIQTDDLLVNDFVFTGNAGDSSGYGIEFHATFEPNDHWLFRANAVVNEPEVSRPDPNFPIAAGVVLPGATEWSGSFSTLYHSHAELFGRSGDISITLSGDLAGPSTLSFGTDTKIGSRSEFDLRAGFETGFWQLSAYAENIFDSADPTFSNGNPYQTRNWDMITPLRPRTIGLQISKSF